jgi:hypothetical protein
VRKKPTVFCRVRGTVCDDHSTVSRGHTDMGTNSDANSDANSEMRSPPQAILRRNASATQAASARTIAQYAARIWEVKPCPVA